MAGADPKNIYVQIDIAAPIDRLWELTQTPDLHEKWDLRFSHIAYLPRPDASQPQQFLYETRIGFGLRIRGFGESVGSHDSPDGIRSSALKFGSDDPKSLIRAGSGYWRYLPAFDGQSVRFITAYDYNVRFGLVGQLFDRMLFRPLMGWATAWSFDRLRLWIEEEIHPATSMRQSVTHFVARVTLAFVWLYQGIVPKLIFRHADELSMLRATGVSESVAPRMIVVAGTLEVAIGLLVLLAWRSRWILWFVIAAMPVALVTVAINSPRFLIAAFNPVSLNVAVFALAIVALLATRDLPSASHCLRKPPLGDR